MTKATNRAIGAVVVVVAISAIAAYAAAPTSMPGPLVPIGISDVENLSTARILERSRILNRQREAITRRLKDIESELRNTSIALNINGIGTPGRFNAKEMELSSLIRRQMELRERSSDLVTEINVLVTSSKEAGATTTSRVQEVIEADATTIALRKAIGEVDVKLAEATAAGGALDMLPRQRDALKEALDRQLAKARQDKTANRVADLKLQLKQTQSALDTMQKRTDAVKEDLGAYSTQMNTYSARQGEEKALVDRLTKIDDELDLLITVEQLREEQATTQPSL